MLRKDIKNERGSIENTYSQRVLDVSLLPRRKLVVKHKELKLKGCEPGSNLLQLALTDIRGWINALEVLIRLSDDLQLRGCAQLVQLF